MHKPANPSFTYRGHTIHVVRPATEPPYYIVFAGPSIAVVGKTLREIVMRLHAYLGAHP